MLGWWINKQSQLNNRKMTEQQQEELDRALIEVVSKGNVDKCERLIQAGADVDATNSFGWTPLHLAALNGYVEVCRLLIDREADINAMTISNWTPLHHAAFRGHVKVCRLLIDRGASVHAIDDEGLTPLHYAAWWGQADVCRLLIQAGANVNSVDRNGGWTPLHQAAYSGHAEVCRLLIEQGANVNAITLNNETPLDLAIGIHAVGVFAYFYVHGVVNFHVVDHIGRKPWDRLTAEQQETLTKAMAEHQEKIAILQTKGLPNELARLVMGYL